MDIRFRTRNTETGDGFRQAIEEKLSKATKVLDSVDAVEVELTENHSRHTPERFRLEVNTVVHGRFVRIVSEAATPESALDDAADRFSRQLRRLKEKMIDGHRKPAPEQPGPSAEDDGVEIVRIKKFSMKPMSIEEAALQMDMLGHSFFLFLNSATDKQSVLYERADGRLGLIEPS